jgi:mRNA interferase MazF
VRRGEIWWLEHPALGRRPACVLTRQRTIPVLTELVVVTATTTIRGIDTEVALGTEDGMPKECVLAFDSIWTVPRAMLVERITEVPQTKLPQICEALRIATGC